MLAEHQPVRTHAPESAPEKSTTPHPRLRRPNVNTDYIPKHGIDIQKKRTTSTSGFSFANFNQDGRRHHLADDTVTLARE
ncbi:MAG: hypothetical protein R3C44_22870 [Chloroflexota bacterium]